MSDPLPGLAVWAPDGVAEVRAGDDLADLLLAALEGALTLADGDVVAVTSKVVSKAEGQVRHGGRDAAVAEEVAAPGARVVARRGGTRIVRNRLGLTMAAAGVDASNTEAGTALLLPADPDASAERLRAALVARTGARVGVLVTDTMGRAWRDGQTDVAIGAAGLRVSESFAGREDAHGNPLVVTLPAVADELAGAAELAQGKLAARPFAVLRGRADLVLDEPGPGARSLVRPEGADLFGWGAREAVVQAVAVLLGSPDADPGALPAFGAPLDAEELREVLSRACGDAVTVDDGPDGLGVAVADPRARPLLDVVLAAHGWAAVTDGDRRLRLEPRA
ncbi:coenzyme F420-0:L-glutamate ligase [Nocardioides bruguierae]|uniref:Coenzyme F420-0:L-glutamate ligase n=1 Tax=Nocardioides bruguierae TaxID=2945102 RepID=A0A9X2D5T1_9ACTN|nr:coenzyme F420-0:L-glutamate ligase [Nocardioides bruguierae]MCM0619382.1 coenzyme F420-0:L-glutamate ligase [Nocardioides bruguierae]